MSSLKRWHATLALVLVGAFAGCLQAPACGADGCGPAVGDAFVPAALPPALALHDCRVAEVEVVVAEEHLRIAVPEGYTLRSAAGLMVPVMAGWSRCMGDAGQVVEEHWLAVALDDPDQATPELWYRYRWTIGDAGSLAVATEEWPTSRHDRWHQADRDLVVGTVATWNVHVDGQGLRATVPLLPGQSGGPGAASQRFLAGPAEAPCMVERTLTGHLVEPPGATLEGPVHGTADPVPHRPRAVPLLWEDATARLHLRTPCVSTPAEK